MHLGLSVAHTGTMQPTLCMLIVCDVWASVPADRKALPQSSAQSIHTHICFLLLGIWHAAIAALRPVRLGHMHRSSRPPEPAAHAAPHAAGHAADIAAKAADRRPNVLQTLLCNQAGELS